MDTPICRFVRGYAARDVSRLHMPGHKGRGPLGCEQVDITEIEGADDLSCPEGIIAASEANASALFGSRATFYSTGGSSQCVKAMLLLAARRYRSRLVLAARNAHKSFLHACALLGLEPRWLYPERGVALCACPVTPAGLEKVLASLEGPPCAVYITSPDYLGGIQDIPALAAVAHAHGVPLLVDNAHGAYLAFLDGDMHPLARGADLCCDSAHKTLGVLTGGAYLHVARGSAWDFGSGAREALAVMGSSSPSYLVLQSLDAVNARLADRYRAELAACAQRVEALRERLSGLGVPVAASDPLRVTVAAHEAGYTGFELAELLRAQSAEPEFADPDWLVLMFTPDNPARDYERVEAAFAGFSPRLPRAPLPMPEAGEACMSPRDALLAARERVSTGRCAGRIMASAAVTCPPAVPIAVMGERITPAQANLMARYGVEYVDVVL